MSLHKNGDNPINILINNIMQMKDLLKTRFVALLSGASQLTTKETKSAYENFKKHLKDVCSSNDNVAVHWRLSEARVELASLEPILRHGQGGGMCQIISTCEKLYP